MWLIGILIIGILTLSALDCLFLLWMLTLGQNVFENMNICLLILVFLGTIPFLLTLISWLQENK
ncbi:MAG: hypothetical protein BV456_04605 [Thermoplasmata archaeon M8B2D]|nr:MAG: hypothetical protein BV456_04605 [Thermoplasmata archaeon M8B2D]